MIRSQRVGSRRGGPAIGRSCGESDTPRTPGEGPTPRFSQDQCASASCVFSRWPGPCGQGLWRRLRPRPRLPPAGTPPGEPRFPRFQSRGGFLLRGLAERPRWHARGPRGCAARHSPSPRRPAPADVRFHFFDGTSFLWVRQHRTLAGGDPVFRTQSRGDGVVPRTPAPAARCRDCATPGVDVRVCAHASAPAAGPLGAHGLGKPALHPR